MPSKKTIVIFIVCLGFVVSVYLLARNPENVPVLAGKTAVSTSPYIQINEETNTDWQKILTNIDQKQNVTTTLPGIDPNIFDETSLTAQMSRDMFSRYLLIANKEGGITSNDAGQIAGAVLSTPDYTKTVAVVYSEKNLKVVNINNDTVKKYKEEMNRIIVARSSQVTENPLDIINLATQNEDEKEMAKLDPIISTAKSFLDDLTATQVPKNAAKIHLDLLNSSSSLLSDLEAMRMTLNDPVRGLSGASMYFEHLSIFQNATNNMSLYLAGRN